ncbi:MAG: hypothetical protein V7742_16330 [Halioglobus sp.]
MMYLKLFTAGTVLVFVMSVPVVVIAQENETSDLKDMSDPLAVYTRVGAGLTNLGVNLKVGIDYDTGKDSTTAMHVLEIKGVLGETLGWGDDDLDEDVSIDNRDNSIDNLRYRNFVLNKENGRGSQLDVNYVFDESYIADQSGDISYSFLQGFNPVGKLKLYPLIGAGLAFGKDSLEDDGEVDSGYSINGTFLVAGMFGKYAFNKKFWVNYNPFWATTLTGSDVYKDNAYGQGNDSVLTHEVAVGYQFSPRMNVRYFGNWNEYNNFSDGIHKVEFNYQL